MYNFSLFSVQLNEPESNVAPTDSRFRPDQRLMEDTRCKFYICNFNQDVCIDKIMNKNNFKLFKRG